MVKIIKKKQKNIHTNKLLPTYNNNTKNLVKQKWKIIYLNSVKFKAGDE